jgi:Na+-transporting NADH:ubiquinone oxidoreductase subunit A
MGSFKITKGLDLPITGTPSADLTDGAPTDRVAIVAADYVGMKPRIICKVGEEVKRGQPLFEDRKNPGVFFTAIGAGKVVAINRGERRALQSYVIELNERERNGATSAEDRIQFASHSGSDPSADELEALLVESGLWTAIRTRPFSRIPELGSRPDAIFFTCTDTEPLSPPAEIALTGREEDFSIGAKALAKFASKTAYLCTSPGSKVPDVPGTERHEFSGKHPAGLVGTHIANLYPVTRKRVVWHIQLQDIIAVGHLLRTGELDFSRVISIAGPPVSKPRLINTRLGASTDILCSGEVPAEDEFRVISGSCISGRTAMGDAHGYLGRYHRQITVLKEGREREFIGWLMPGGNKFSTIPAFLSALMPGKKFDFTTSTNGEHREMVPIGMYERVMPLDILPTFLLRAMEIGDSGRAEKLGALELDEEDLALCSFVCPGKQDYGIHLRKILDEIHKEG